MRINTIEELEVYRRAYRLSMAIFRESRAWPNEEKYSLTDQVRRSSRSVCANLAEAWAKRRYPDNFVSKLTDCDAENSETRVWLHYARDCGYMDDERHELSGETEQVGAMLGGMLKAPEKFIQDPD